MARRTGRKGQYLVTDDYTGITRYSSEVRKDYWGNIVKKELKRNLQEIASPLNDPEPVPFYRGPSYEPTDPSMFSTAPLYIGKTTTPTPKSLASYVFNWDVGIPDAAIGSTFVVR